MVYNSMKLFLSSLLLSLPLITNPCIAAPSKGHSVLDKMVASVNDEAITESELDKQTQLILIRLKPTELTLPPMSVLKKQVLDRMIIDRIQMQQAKELGIEIDQATVNQTLNDMVKHDDLSFDEWRQFLEDQGVSFEYFKDSVKNELLISRLQQQEVGKMVSVSNIDVDHFVNSPAGQDQSGTEYRIGHILIALPENASVDTIHKKNEEAKNIVQQLKTGSNFAQMAMARSNGQHALEGGDLGFRKTAEIPSLFAKEAALLQIGEVYGPIKNESGFHIIKLIDKRIEGTSLSAMPTESQVQQILIKTGPQRSDQEAKQLLAHIKQLLTEKNASFKTLAQKYSEEAISKEKGGVLGWVTPTQVLPEFSTQINKLKTGEISEPFKTDLGWHLVQVIKRRSHLSSVESMRNKAMDILFRRKFDEQLISWQRRLKEDAEVQVYLDES